ncbi:MAG: HNH endonuclease [Phycisphaerales bacterium]
MAALDRQINDADKQKVLNQQTRDGVLHCFVDDHPVEAGEEVHFHHVKPFSEDGPTEIANIGAVCVAHHRRIRTLSLSEFRDQLELDRFFEHPEPRRLDHLLTQKLSGTGFGKTVVAESSPGQMTLHFTASDASPAKFPIFTCPATGMPYFYAVLPIEYVKNDEQLQPRPLEKKRVWEMYRHLSFHTQLAPAVCRLVDGHILLFDGQHKSAAQIWAGRRLLDCKVYISPDVRKLKDTNLVAHDKLRQMAFFTSTLIAKYSDIFKQEWEDYVEGPGSKTEEGFTTFLKARGKTTLDAKKMLMMAIEQDVLDDRDNALAEFISERNRSRQNPITIALLQKTFFKDFIYSPPTAVEIEGPEDFRSDEKHNLVRLMSMIAQKVLAGRWNPEANNASHQRAERILSAGTLRAWCPMLRDVVAQVLQLYAAIEREKILFRKVSDQQWSTIEGRVDRLLSHKIWDDPSPDVALQLKANAAEQIREFLNRQHLTVNWVLGGDE